ncbi:hypothetical protein SDC9_146331 [bioreactor metagenome]|uniref:Uncharacterized protein n=1 Tax=bioreactor metagenome TaxID=1076179 RepID=A0A645EBC4_9ZZZZ
MAVAAQLEAVAQHEELADGRAREHHQNQHQPVQLMVVEPAIVVGQHGEQHRQREIRVVHRTLLAALAVDGIDRLTRLERRHHLALAGDDPEEHIGAHRRCQHRAHQQKRCLPREDVASQKRGNAHQYKHQRTHNAIAVLALAKHAADAVVQQPEHHQKRQRRRNCHVRVHGVGAGRIDEVDVGVPQIRHREQRKA